MLSDDEIEISAFVVKYGKDVEGLALVIDVARSTLIADIRATLAQKLKVPQNLVSLWNVSVFLHLF